MEEKFKAFVDWMHAEHTDLAYRYVYAAYCATGGPWEKTSGYATLHVWPEGGGFVLKAGGDVELVLDNADELSSFHDYLVRRYCRDKYPDMATWEAQQHKWFMEWP